jgi:hypothetical protein
MSRVLGRNWWPMVPEVQDPEVALEPSIKRVAGAGCLSDARIGPHMVL